MDGLLLFGRRPQFLDGRFKPAERRISVGVSLLVLPVGVVGFVQERLDSSMDFVIAHGCPDGSRPEKSRYS